MTERVRTTIEGERFVHKELWRIVMRQLEHSKKNPSGAFYDDLVAMVFAFHALDVVSHDVIPIKTKARSWRAVGSS